MTCDVCGQRINKTDLKEGKAFHGQLPSSHTESPKNRGKLTPVGLCSQHYFKECRECGFSVPASTLYRGKCIVCRQMDDC